MSKKIEKKGAVYTGLQLQRLFPSRLLVVVRYNTVASSLSLSTTTGACYLCRRNLREPHMQPRMQNNQWVVVASRSISVDEQSNSFWGFDFIWLTALEIDARYICLSCVRHFARLLKEVLFRSMVFVKSFDFIFLLTKRTCKNYNFGSSRVIMASFILFGQFMRKRRVRRVILSLAWKR